MNHPAVFSQHLPDQSLCLASFTVSYHFSHELFRKPRALEVRTYDNGKFSHGVVSRCNDAHNAKRLILLIVILAKWMPASASISMGIEPVVEKEDVTAVGDMPESESEYGSPEVPTPKPTASSDADQVIDPSALKDMFGDDDETFKGILEDFIEPTRDIAREISDAYSAHVAKEIGAAAHKLKSSSRSVGVNALVDLCQKLEVAGKSDDWESIDALYPDLDGLLRAVIDYIEAL